MSARYAELCERRDAAAERLGRARAASDRSPGNLALEQAEQDALVAFQNAEISLLQFQNGGGS